MVHDWTLRELRLLRWAVLATRAPVDAEEATEWAGLGQLLGRVDDVEWQALLDHLRAAAADAS